MFPKGHIERGETTKETALREVAEEAGVNGRIICSAGRLSFAMEYTEMFLMEFRSIAETPAERECAWLDVDAAEARLSFENTRELLRSADKIAKSA